mgnify:CR=1 FL=1
MNNCIFCKSLNSVKNCSCELCGSFVCEDFSKEPSFITKVTNFIPAVIKHVVSGSEKVSTSVQKERMAICKSCPFFNSIKKSPICNHCGCNLEDKTTWADAKCPIGKWHDIKTASNGGCGCQKT